MQKKKRKSNKETTSGNFDGLHTEHNQTNKTKKQIN